LPVGGQRGLSCGRKTGRKPVGSEAIEHVGSTSVPGLAAKPVIDCDIVVAGQDVAAASGALTGLGFKPLGDLGIPLRWAFQEPDRLARTNTYIVVEGSLSLRNHLAVRDILRADSGLREQYSAVKRRVGATAADIDEYGRGKNAMVQRILAAAGLTDAERASIDADQVPSHDERGPSQHSQSYALHPMCNRRRTCADRRHPPRRDKHGVSDPPQVFRLRAEVVHALRTASSLRLFILVMPRGAAKREVA
jgi:GrpB-like predicted nucleotidyltransferase (UPF0157 family)